MTRKASRNSADIAPQALQRMTLQWMRQQGFKPVALSHRSKAAVSNDYTKLDYQPPGDEFWRDGRHGIGCALGPQQSGPVDGDLDCEEARFFGKRWLLPTVIFGRDGSQQSHYLYLSSDPKFRNAIYDDPCRVKDARILELRADGGHQTVFPGSLHQDTGELIQWTQWPPPELGTVSRAELVQIAGKISAATVIVRHVWLSGYRDQPCMHMAGALRRWGWSLEETIEFIKALDDYNDIREASRIPTIRSTYAKAEAGEPVTGAKRLREQLKNDALVDRLEQWLDRRPPSNKQGSQQQRDAYRSQPPLEIEMVKLSEVKMRRVEWLWPGLIPKNKLTLVVGDPGDGKTQAVLEFVSRVTRGAVPPLSEDEKSFYDPMDVMILCTEDAPDDTIKPRLEAVGADTSRVTVITGMKDAEGRPIRGLDFTQDLEQVEKLLDQHPNCGLIVVDPITENVGIKTDGNANVGVRAALSQVNRLLHKRKITMVGVSHLAKTKRGKVSTAAIGSIAFSAGCRSLLYLYREMTDPDDGEEPQETGRRIVAVAKFNNASPEQARSYAFRIEGVEIDGEDGVPIDTSMVVWEESVESRAAHGWDGDGKDKQTPRQKAKAKMRALMKNANGEPCDRLAEEMRKELFATGFKEHTFERARKELGIVPYRKDEDGRYWWPLPASWALPNF